MRHSATAVSKIGKRNLLHVVVFALAMTTFSLHAANTWAGSWKPSDYRVTYAGQKFDETWQQAVAFRLRPPRRLRARRLELAIGAISTSEEIRPFVSLGPVWRLPIRSQTVFFELGFSPTLVGGSRFNGRDLGGNFHFTSSIALGANLGARKNFSVSLRMQHTSNGGLNSTNPGMDMIGLNIAFKLSD